MTTIRPAGQPPIPAAPPRSAEAARTAAQKAFFELAMGKAAAPAAAAPTPAARTAAPAPAGPQTIAAAPAASPARPLRPGSLLDIRV